MEFAETTLVSFDKTVVARWLGELEDRVPLWFDVLDEDDILASWLAENFRT